MGRKRVRWFGVRSSLGMPSKTGFCPVQPILYRPLLFPVRNIRQRLSIEIRIGQYSPNAFLCIVKRKYGFSVYPIGCTPAFLFVFVIIRLFRFRYTFYHVNDYGIKLCGVL